MKIEIWSDVACPFCYIGRERLFKVMDELQMRDDIKISWKSFILDPTLTDRVDGDIYETLAEKKGMTAAAVTQMIDQVDAMAKGKGSVPISVR